MAAGILNQNLSS